MNQRINNLKHLFRRLTESERFLTLLELGLTAAGIFAFWVLPVLWAFGIFLLLATVYPALTRQWQLYSWLTVSVGFAVVWLLFAHDMYGYNVGFPELFGFSLFPLMAFSLCLFAVVLLFKNLSPRRLAKSNRVVRFTFYSFFYWTLLIFFEAGTYHWLGIHNDATGMYEGLPYCDCMHAPNWMQASYFALGPLYYLAIGGVNRFAAAVQRRTLR